MSDRPHTMRPSFELDWPFQEEAFNPNEEPFALSRPKTVVPPPPAESQRDVIEAFVVTTPRGEELVPLDYDDEPTKVYGPGELDALLTVDSHPTLRCPPSAPVQSREIEVHVMDCMSQPLRISTPPRGMTKVRAA